MNQESQKRAIAPWLLIIFISVLLIGVGFFAWYYYNHILIPTSVTKSTKILTPIIESTNGRKIYKNKFFKYSISIPENWTVLPNGPLMDNYPSQEIFDEDVGFADSQMQEQLRIIACDACKTGNQYGTLKNYASDVGPPDRESLITNQKQFQIGQVNGYKETVFNSFYNLSNTTEYFAESQNAYLRFISLNNSNQVEEILATFKLN